jgi:chromosome segregation ATPase
MDQPATKGDIQEVLTVVREIAGELRELSKRVDGLSEKLDATNEQVERLSDKLDATKEQLVNHTNGIAAELHLQIQSAETRLTTKISAVEKRLELQGGLIQSGARAMARFIKWTEGTDIELSGYEHRLTLLEKRVNNLEGHQ